MGEKHRDREDRSTTVRLGSETARLKRLTIRRNESDGEILRQALIKFELGERDFAIDVRDAVLCLFQSLLPDEQYDPVEDPRQVEAVQTLGRLLNSNSAAEGIAEAFTMLFTMNMLAMSDLHFPSEDEDVLPGEQLFRQNVELDEN